MNALFAGFGGLVALTNCTILLMATIRYRNALREERRAEACQRMQNFTFGRPLRVATRRGRSFVLCSAGNSNAAGSRYSGAGYLGHA
jgi:hypothetical protein